MILRKLVVSSNIMTTVLRNILLLSSEIMITQESLTTFRNYDYSGNSYYFPKLRLSAITKICIMIMNYNYSNKDIIIAVYDDYPETININNYFAFTFWN